MRRGETAAKPLDQAPWEFGPEHSRHCPEHLPYRIDHNSRRATLMIESTGLKSSGVTCGQSLSSNLLFRFDFTGNLCRRHPRI